MSLFDHYKVQIFTCTHCGLITENPLDSGEGDYYCPNDECGREYSGEYCTERLAKYLSIAMYETSRQYGGPEEGGWWYDTGCIVAGTQRSFLPEDAPQAAVYKDLLWMRIEAERKLQHRWAIDGSYSLRITIEDDAVKGYPARRPHYC